MDFTVTAWSAWAPALSSRDAFDRWAHGQAEWGEEGVADVSFLPARFRRRLTPLAKMGLSAAYGCLVEADVDPGTIRTVFSSRFGEHLLSVHILREIIQNEVVSPMRFAMSVHNSTSGLFSIGAGNKELTTAIAGGKDTFFYALLEAAAMLHRDASTPVLVVMCEEPLDPIYHDYTDEAQIPYAVAYLLSKDGPGQRVSLTLGKGDEIESTDDPNEMPRAMSCLKWLLQDDRPQWVCHSGPRRWQWTKPDAGFVDEALTDEASADAAAVQTNPTRA